MNQESEPENQELQTTLLPQFFAPQGIRFNPSDFELVRFYLFQKIQGNLDPLVTHLLVRDCDLFASQEPWQIWNNFTATSPYLDNTDLFFFTELKPRSNTDSRFKRKVGSGTWHGENGKRGAHQFKVVIDNNLSFMAYKKRFTYKNEDSNQHGCWILFEYSLPSISTKTVLCRLRNKNNNNNNNEEEEEEEEVESKNRNRAQSVGTKKRKRVIASASTTTDDAYDDTTNTVYNASEGLTAFNGDEPVSKALEEEPIEPKDMTHADETAADFNDDSDYTYVDAGFADAEYFHPGAVVQGEVAAGYDWDIEMPIGSIVDASVTDNLDAFYFPLTSIGSSVDNLSLGYEVIDSSHTNWDDFLCQSLIQEQYPHCYVQENAFDPSFSLDT